MNELLPWYIAGPLIGLIVPALLLLREKQFGVSSSYRYFGAYITNKKIKYFNYDSRTDAWQAVFALGLVLAGVAGTQLCQECVTYTGHNAAYEETAKTIYDMKNAWQFFVGGILVGFGARYANGCTAGHCIMGVSQFAPSSIIATTCFFIGGLIATYFINPFIF